MCSMDLPPTGQCALCREHRELCDSHFMPKALYRLVRDKKAKNPHPYLISLSGSRQTSKSQATHYLLCATCEKLFDQNGEDWVMRHCYRGRNVFRLRALLQQSAEVERGEDAIVYSATAAPETIHKLAYFCASVLWRAAVRNWRFLDQAYEAIPLGIYQEQFRTYLLGNSDFPSNAVVNVVLSHLTSPVLAWSVPETIRIDRCRVHRFHVPGITFSLYLGKQAPVECSPICLLRSPIHPIYVAKFGDAFVQTSLLVLMGKIKTPAPADSVMEGYENALPD